MTRSAVEVPVEDRFGRWFRFRSVMVLNLLYLAGPAQLDEDHDPRAAIEKEYERRRDLYRERTGRPAIVKKSAPAKGGLDVVVLCAVGGIAALVVLVVWAVATAR